MEFDNLLYFLPYALLGFLISVVGDVFSSGVAFAELSLKKWAQDNVVRILFSALCLTAGLLFSEEILGSPLTKLTAFWGGVGSDNLVNFFVRRKANITKKQQ